MLNSYSFKKQKINKRYILLKKERKIDKSEFILYNIAASKMIVKIKK